MIATFLAYVYIYLIFFVFAKMWTVHDFVTLYL